MMTKLRESTAIIMWIVILAFVGLIVVEWGADYSGTSTATTSGSIGSINGEEISLRYFQEAVRNAARQRSSADRGNNSQMIREVWDAMVGDILIRREVDRLGIEISDAEVAHYARSSPPPAVQALPTFHNEEGEFDPALYSQFINDRNTYSDPGNRAFVLQVEQLIRSQLLNLSMQQLLMETERVTPNEVRQFYSDQNEKVTMDYAFAPAATVPMEEVTLNEEEIQAHFEEMRVDFQHPAQIRTGYVAFPRVPSAADSASVVEEIAQLRSEIVDDGADFAEMAAAVSEDQVSAPNGGDLGTFRRSAMVDAFAEAAFALQPGEISQPVQTRFGWHLIKVEERFPPETDDEEQIWARHILLKHRPSANTEEGLQQRADEVRVLAEQIGLIAAASTQGLTFRDLGYLSEGSTLPGLGDGTLSVVNQFFASEVGTLTQVGSVESGYFIAELLDKREVGTASIEEMRTRVESSLRSRKRSELAGRKLEEIRQAVRGGQSFAEAAAAAGLEVRSGGPFSRNDFVPGVGRGSKFITAAFNFEPGDWSDVVVQANGSYLIHLKEKSAVDETLFAEQRREFEEQLLSLRRREALQVWLAQLYENADIRDNRHEFYSF
ncbi:MAG: peptidylprolyl isomerase [Candidatus Latescibacterota bacterium]|nr:peptidylprolyl isomerase [Candidatus Latescibacterota bacterium]